MHNGASAALLLTLASLIFHPDLVTETMNPLNEGSKRHDEEEYERAYLMRRFQFMPWTRVDVDLEEQTRIRAILARHAGARISESAYISPDANVFTRRLTVGRRTWIASGSIVRGHIEIGSDCTLNPYCHVAGVVRIGSGVRIAGLVSIYGFNHGHARTDIPIYKQRSTSKGISIGDNVWIGANAVVLDGAEIGSDCIIGAGAVIRGSVEPFSIVVGNPGYILKSRQAAGAAEDTA